MQALMLAAGMGKRLQKYTQNGTKCMIKVGGKTLLEHACDALKYAGIHKMILVVGYYGEELVNYALQNIEDMEFEFVYNTVYNSTNNIYSLYLARDFLRREDTILLESDLIYDKEVIRDLVQDENKNLAVVAKYEYWMDGTVCKLDKSGNIVEFVDKKDFSYSIASQYFKTVNIYRFSKEFSANKYIPFLETYIQVYGTNQYYESVLKIIAHINKMDLKAFDIGEKKWYEIDNAQDYNIANTMFQTQDLKLKGYEYLFGGYWRFPKIIDYCYLVNPYFPTERLKEQLKYMFDTLLTQYPSGMKVQRINTAKAFGLDENCVVIGNGAAELINVLGHAFEGKIGIPIPAFNEYIRCFSNNTKVHIISEREDKGLDKKLIMETIPKVDMLILINPDNPSGYFIDWQDLNDIIEECMKQDVFCVIDESFGDFVEKGRRFSLLNQYLLKENEKLIVIKSISKSYGVPGLRLGILATYSQEIMSAILENQAIWNINSFAEYFLEILPLYNKEYVGACDRLVEEREYMMSQLKQIPQLVVYPSQANYIMCRLKDISSRSFANILLEKYNILIKDLSVKSGFDEQQYIRIAIRDRQDNDYLLKAIYEIFAER